jgi:PAS domain S-box-containing protein
MTDGGASTAEKLWIAWSFFIGMPLRSSRPAVSVGGARLAWISRNDRRLLADPIMTTTARIDPMLWEERDPSKERRRGPQLHSFTYGAVTIGLLTGAFLLDLMSPIGVAAWAPYPVAVLAALLLRGGTAALSVAIVSIGLTMLGARLSPPGEMWIGFLNRVYGVSVIILVAWLCLYIDQNQEGLRAALSGSVSDHERLGLCLEATKAATIILLDPKGLVAGWYGEAEQLTGYHLSEILGQSVSVLFPDEDPRSGTMFHLLARSAKDGMIEARGRCLSKAGVRFEIHRTITALRNSGNRLVGYSLEIRQDVKDGMSQKAIHESERHMDDLLHNNPGVPYRCGPEPERVLEHIGPGISDLAGYRPHHLIGTAPGSLNRLIHPEERERVRTCLSKVLRERRPYQLVYRIVTSAGKDKLVWDQGECELSEDGKVVALQGLLVDITD